uniref:methionine--tRNA ligase n=1 Tax=Chaetoceros debilis TaxID=122233 RepID=A0A7S3PW86_9STRA|mmetsp:Transcript_3542/g.5236  ORF Transcript_3542/g.5236 Transcript_3542/m.5236 type:complete len:822 (+) Transcript_3542:66-2531(+)
MALNDQSDELSAALRATLLISSMSVGTGKDSQDSPAAPVKSVANKDVANKDTSSGKFERWSLTDDSKIDYGCYASKEKVGEYDETKKGFYITTAINYTNGPAHMGHAYEAATADAIARYNSSKYGHAQSYFVTGSDEHGQKIAITAADANPPMKPIDLCNKFVTGFQVLNQRMLIANDDYVRTTSARHKNTARELWKRCAGNNTNGESDIYLSKYEGWYNVREETFVTDSDAKLADYKDATSGLPLKKVEEESYFFRMGAYHDKLVQHINDNPNFIRPTQYRNNILARLNGDKLRDLSISRTTFDWGIPVPEGFNAKHVMYVWFDALSNYLTGINALEVNGENHKTNRSCHWPASVHIIGKDIIWFHTVIWPCILMSAGLPLPTTVFSHGFVNDSNGMKMSKSIGNVVDPHDMLDKFPVDGFRWYLCKEAPYGGELSFSEESLSTMYNADLCDTLGNLIHRATNLCKKYCNGVVPDVPAPEKAPIDFEKIRADFMSKMDNFELDNGAAKAMEGFRDINGFLTEQAPWHMKGDERAEERQIVVRATLEAVYAMAHLLIPFIPIGAKQIFQKLNTAPIDLLAVKSDLRNLVPQTKVDVGDVLYSKIVSEEEKLNAKEAAKKKASSLADAQKRKKEKKAAAAASSKAGGKQGATDANQPAFTKADIRVGQITKVWYHPDADKLFCEEIDVGEKTGPRQITSGLRGHYELSDMQDKKVLVVCNLKAVKIVGFASNGMVLAAKAEDGSKVELVTPPSNAQVGERVFIDGLTGEPASSAQMKKKKIWDEVAKELKTGEEGVATWQGKVIKTSAGNCAAATIVGAPIS